MKSPEKISPWYHKIPDNEQRLEAIKNLSRENFRNGATNPDTIFNQIVYLLETGFISQDEADNLKERVRQLSTFKK